MQYKGDKRELIRGAPGGVPVMVIGRLKMVRIGSMVFAFFLVAANIVGSEAGDTPAYETFLGYNFVRFNGQGAGQTAFSDVVLQSNGAMVKQQAFFGINYDTCAHLGNNIICPPGVPAGSTSLFFNSMNWPVFPGPNGTQIAVDPSEIMAYPPQVEGTFGTDPIVNQVTFSNIPFYNTGKNQIITISGLSFDDNAIYDQSPGTNPSIWLTLSLSPPSLSIDAPQIPYAVLTNNTPPCDESFLSITPGYPTYVRARNIAFSGNLYEVDMPVVSLPDGSPGLSVSSIRQGSSCPNTGNSFTQSGLLTLSKVNVNGTDYSAQLQWTGSAFQILSVH